MLNAGKKEDGNHAGGAKLQMDLADQDPRHELEAQPVSFLPTHHGFAGENPIPLFLRYIEVMCPGFDTPNPNYVRERAQWMLSYSSQNNFLHSHFHQIESSPL